jgi:hypothetical protein
MDCNRRSGNDKPEVVPKKSWRESSQEHAPVQYVRV